jgi:2-iminobutanoate/2-iminopropanoate deaminase
MLRKITTDRAPRAVGPYSQAITLTGAENLIFVSGQLPLDPDTGEMIEGDFKDLVSKTIDNVEAVLHAADSSLEDVLRVEVFLKDIGNYAVMNEVYMERFVGPVFPARQAVEVSKLPKDSEIEISCIAIKTVK